MGRFRVIIEGFETIPSNSNPKKPVEVIDTWTKESTVYASLSEAARAIGCVIQTVASALKKSPPGVASNPIKKRYKVKQIIGD